MKIEKGKLINKGSYLEGEIDSEIAEIATKYKNSYCRGFISINPEQIGSKLGGSEYFVTRKIDGELGVLFYDGKETLLVNSSGKGRAGLPCLEEAKEHLKKEGIGSAVLACELYAEESGGRTRIYDVLAALGKEGDVSSLRLAVFDIVELDETPFKPDLYSETHSRISEIFSSGRSINPVPMKSFSSRNEVSDIFDTWVKDENAEGIVVHSEMPQVFKIKPRHQIDAVIIGYTEGDGENTGSIREILLALMKKNGNLQIIGKTGNGFSDDQKKDMFKLLSGKHIESDYIETDSRNMAFHMVIPETVIEIAVTDILTENSKGNILKPVLKPEKDQITFIRTGPGVSLLHTSFERIRDDKSANLPDIRFEQVSSLVYVKEEPDNKTELNKSKMISRDVYRKESKGNIMVLKIITWKTNKEKDDPRFPGYVMHFTNFSSGRKDPLKREIRISSSEKQILEISEEYIEKNVKKGWVKV